MKLVGNLMKEILYCYRGGIRLNRIQVSIHPDKVRYRADVYNQEGKKLVSVVLNNRPHLWYMDLLLGGYRIYWQGVGDRDVQLNVFDGITYHGEYGGEELCKIGYSIIRFTCRDGCSDQSNTLRRVSLSRYVLIESSCDGRYDIYVTGGVESPRWFIRPRGEERIIGRYLSIAEAREAMAVIQLKGL